jgi:hypothetical protein
MSMTNLYKQTLEYQEGRGAYREGERRAHNPYASGEKQGSASAWWLGWDDEEAEDIKQHDSDNKNFKPPTEKELHDYYERFDEDNRPPR